MKYLLIILTLLLSSCEPTVTQKEIENHERFLKKYTIVTVIDSCEYIYYDGGNAGLLTHKGNCKFCKIRNQK